MITRDGHRMWTTDELAASLIARGRIDGTGSRPTVRRRALRWASDEQMRPVARTKTGGLLWAEDAALVAVAH